MGVPWLAFLVIKQNRRIRLDSGLPDIFTAELNFPVWSQAELDTVSLSEGSSLLTCHRGGRGREHVCSHLKATRPGPYLLLPSILTSVSGTVEHSVIQARSLWFSQTPLFLIHLTSNSIQSYAEYIPIKYISFPTIPQLNHHLHLIQATLIFCLLGQPRYLPNCSLCLSSHNTATRVMV